MPTTTPTPAFACRGLTPDDARHLRVRHEYVIANGIDDPCPAGPMADTTPISAQRPLRILFVAMLRESKGVLVLIEAAARLAQRGVPFQVEIMGQFITPEFENVFTPACKSWAFRIE